MYANVKGPDYDIHNSLFFGKLKLVRVSSLVGRFVISVYI